MLLIRPCLSVIRSLPWRVGEHMGGAGGGAVTKEKRSPYSCANTRKGANGVKEGEEDGRRRMKGGREELWRGENKAKQEKRGEERRKEESKRQRREKRKRCKEKCQGKGKERGKEKRERERRGKERTKGGKKREREAEKKELQKIRGESQHGIRRETGRGKSEVGERRDGGERGKEEERMNIQ